MKKTIPIQFQTSKSITKMAFPRLHSKISQLNTPQVHKTTKQPPLSAATKHSTIPPEFRPPPNTTKPFVPRTPNVPDFDPITPETPMDLPPITPGPNPEFPGPTVPEVPPPPSPPSPDETPPEVIPPHVPEIIPPKPPEVGPLHPTQLDIPPPISS
ncbi:Gibberellin-regulated protein [Actinidia chinensis var. chinensis]|uniref:Gibberellin-regulated protein n=1 Tax=Actinidia chinensis var. chinensis TaxID=1590841 RepID=A0A2R6PB37_ACTCC|nr:Gibberellin-regulated protein [Actinidia chinensis var. chinensis]